MFAILAFMLIGQTTTPGIFVDIDSGDIITVRPFNKSKAVKVRLMYIDAPEQGQVFGQRAREHLKKMVFAKKVELIGTEKDSDGRLLAVVKVDGVEVNLEMVKAGMAWAYPEHKPPAEYVSAEQKARATKAGLWFDERQPIAPWDYRNQLRAKSKKAV